MQDFVPYKADDIPSLNIWYVSTFYPGDNGRMCRFSAPPLQRLLVCDINDFRPFAESSCGVGADTSVLIIHNTTQYGGAGYVRQDVATITLDEKAPWLAAHELGHSFFGLDDEYVGGYLVDMFSCDASPTCDKWADLSEQVSQGRFPGREVGCVRGCKNSSYRMPHADSVMNTFETKDFGLVGERATCCKYLSYAAWHGMPGYCEQFNMYGLDLNSYCSQYTSLGVESIAIERPVLWRLTRVEGKVWTCERQQALDSGLYPAWRRHGEKPEDVGLSSTAQGGITVAIEDANSGVRAVKWFSDKELVEVPPQLPGDLAEEAESHIFMDRSTIDIVLEEGQSCHAA